MWYGVCSPDIQIFMLTKATSNLLYLLILTSPLEFQVSYFLIFEIKKDIINLLDHLIFGQKVFSSVLGGEGSKRFNH